MSLFIFILTITTIYFLSGIIGVSVISKNKKNNSVWTKLIVYAIVVYGILFLIRYGFISWMILLVYAIGLYEIVKVSRNRKGKNRYLFIALLIYIVIGVGLFTYCTIPDIGKQLLLYTVVFVFDGFSQITGQLFGKNRITSISPNKTWEGFTGGVIMAAVTFIYLNSFFEIKVSSHSFLVFGIIILSAFTGDLVASGYKRLYNVKDFSNIIPGHGGILDRFDSFFFSTLFFSAF